MNPNTIGRARWKEPENTKREINKAGNTVREDKCTEQEKAAALSIIDNWRAAHAYPMHVFYMHLRRIAKKHKNALVAERLKRLESIVGKLKLEKEMQLFRMQDLGGCRMVLPTISEVYNVYNELKKSRMRHELQKENDYIQDPKKTGYRSLHMVYKFKTDTSEKNIYNNYPMLIEIQLRTYLQHVWATAVETFGTFMNQALKSGQGDGNIKRFFVIVSSLFALEENCPGVPGESKEKAVLIEELTEINKNNHVVDLLRAIRAAMEHEKGKHKDKKGYYILQLNYETKVLTSFFFLPSEVELANQTYDYLEQKNKGKRIDSVLVRAASFDTVRQAYPNYFMDIGTFVKKVTKYLKL